MVIFFIVIVVFNKMHSVVVSNFPASVSTDLLPSCEFAELNTVSLP